jgi:serine/threonine protein kinase
MTQGAGIGTAAYIAPEVALGKPFDGRADVYALGVMLFGLLTGRPPYQADSKDALIYQHIHEPIPLPRQHKPSLPEGLDAVITRAMAKEADQRYPTCKALADDLAAAINDAPPDEREESPTGFFTMPLPPSPVPVLRSVGTTPLMSAAAQNNRAGHWSLWLLGVLSALTLGALVLAAYLLLRPAPEDNNTRAGSQEIDLSARVEFAIQSTRLVETQTALHATQTAVSLAPVSDEDDESALITAAGVDAGTPSPEPLSEEGSPSPLGTLPAGAANTEWTPVVTDFNGQSMVLVPGGCTVIGSEDGEPDERPTREVCLDPFWIGQTEVTNTQYAQCVAAGECRPPTDRRYFDDPAYAEHPVVFVSWDDAAHNSAWHGVQHPTPAQWE